MKIVISWLYIMKNRKYGSVTAAKESLYCTVPAAEDQIYPNRGAKKDVSMKDIYHLLYYD